MKACSLDNCSDLEFSGLGKCILHCEKGSYADDYRKSDVLPAFYNQLIKTIVSLALSRLGGNLEKTETDLASMLTGEITGWDSVSGSFSVVFEDIWFPHRDGRDAFDYLPVLNRVGSIHFLRCSFMPNTLAIESTKCFFDECSFKERWNVFDYEMLENYPNALYSLCKFEGAVSAYTPDEGEYLLRSTLFSDCVFEASVEFSNACFKSLIFDNSKSYKQEIGSLEFQDCQLDANFILNNCSIGSYLTANTQFGSKVEFKDNNVKVFKVVNCNHRRLVDMFNTEFGRFEIFKSIFDEFVGFEHCSFGAHTEEEASKDYCATFMYVTFLGFVNFRNSTFCSGLDIENINTGKYPNFLKVWIDDTFSNRETFRIIKQAFDSTGNHIEANKFFALEMKKHKEELVKGGWSQERIAVTLNEKISNFGQSYIRPIFWMLAVSILYSLLICGQEHNFLYEIWPWANPVVGWLAQLVNGLASNVMPFAKVLREGMEFVSLVFYVIFASLIWQTIVAVKRLTRR